jgi:hypothetical protein
MSLKAEKSAMQERRACLFNLSDALSRNFKGAFVLDRMKRKASQTRTEEPKIGRKRVIALA